MVGWMEERVDGWMDRKWRDKWVVVQVEGQIDGWMDRWVDGR